MGTTLLDLVAGRLAANQRDLTAELSQATDRVRTQDQILELVDQARRRTSTCNGCGLASTVADTTAHPCACQRPVEVSGIVGQFQPRPGGGWAFSTEPGSTPPRGAIEKTPGNPDPLGSWLQRRAQGERSGEHEFEVLSQLGRGAFGSVYEAIHLPTGTRIALKVLLAGARDQARQARRFEREGKALERLDHPHIVRVLEFGRIRERPFLALELIDGVPLSAAIGPRGYRTIPEAVALARDVADALQHAHERDVIHRDVKPANLLLDAHHQVRLADFGLVTDLGLEWSRLTLTGGIVGTPAYMSPEQIRGASDEALTPATDVYALGVVLFELLTGSLPFEGLPQVELFVNIVESPAPPPSAKNPAVPPQLDAIVQRALAKEPAQRYPSAAALRDDLDAFLGAAPLGSRRRWRWPALGLGAALLLGAVAAATQESPHVEPRQTRLSPTADVAAETTGTRTSPALATLEPLCVFERDTHAWTARPADVSTATITLLPSAARLAPKVGPDPRPRGRGLRLVTSATGSAVWSSPPADWRDCERFSFWVYRSREAAKEDQVLDVLLRSDHGSLWRKVDLKHPGWSHVSLALRWFRRSTGAYVRPGAVRSVYVRLRGAGEVWLDAFSRTLAPGAALRAPEHVQRALPEPSAFRLVRRGPVSILTTNPRLDIEAVLAQLERTYAETRKITRGLSPWSAQGSTLVVLRDRSELVRTVGALARRFGADEPQLEKSQGFVFEQIVFSTAPDDTVRPLFARQLAQATLEAVLGINGYGWLSNGVAEVARARGSAQAQAGLGSVVRRSVRRGRLTRLQNLCRARSLRGTLRWQAFTLVEALIESPRLRTRWIPLLRAFRAAGSTDLEPHLQPVLGVDWDVLEGVWRAHCRTRYGVFGSERRD